MQEKYLLTGVCQSIGTQLCRCDIWMSQPYVLLARRVMVSASLRR